MIKRIVYAVGVSLLLPAAIFLLIIAASGGLFGPQPPTGSQAATQEKVQPPAPQGTWSDVQNFPNVSIGFVAGDPEFNSPLRLKRAGAAAYHPNGKIYILGGRHRIDGNDISMRWIWEYTPGNPGTITQKTALLDQEQFGSRFTANMAVATLTDTNGVRIYAVGGSSVNSTPSNSVRVYDPNSDTLTTSDAWPASPARIPGGWAVYDNKLYIFGGYTSIGGDQVFADTWRFDPMAPSGSRWTQLASANLGTARYGIAGAALNGYVYAIGGNVTTGSPPGNVTPVANVERMNPNDASPTWQAVASLPYPRGDMGAWAYDTGTGYEISGRILTAGGGYPVPDAQVYLYDPAANSWQFFTEMLRPRRNYAYTQLNGSLYAFGGYNVTVNGYWGLFDGDNDSQRYDASGPPPPSIITPTNTPIPSPTSPMANVPYTYTITTGATIVPGTTLVPGSNCVQCLNIVTLPFPFTYYGTTFTQAMVGTSGNLQFMSNANWWVNNCLPDPAFRYVMMPFWDNLSQSGSGSGIYTSITGSAPNRIFNVEWRVGTSTNFEIRLYETGGQFEYIYGTLSTGSQVATIGAQRDNTNFTQVSCNVASVSPGSMISWSQGPPPTATPTLTGTPPTNTPLPTNTPTTPPSATRTRTSTPLPTATATNTVPPPPPTSTATAPAATATSPAATATDTPPVPPATATDTPPVPPATNTPGTPVATPTACALEFADVPPTNTFYPFVRCLACKGIISGYPCGGDFEPCNPNNDPYFRPNNHITRGQLSKVVAQSAGFSEPVPATQQSFEDVPPGTPFWEYVERLYARGIVGGYQCGITPAGPCVPPANRPYFLPDGGATRGQLTKIVSEAAGFADSIPLTQQSYTDVPPSSTFWLYVERLMLNRPGVMNGYACGQVPTEPCDGENRPYFRPGNPLTRGQASKIVANTFFPGCNPAAR